MHSGQSRKHGGTDTRIPLKRIRGHRQHHTSCQVTQSRTHCTGVHGVLAFQSTAIETSTLQETHMRSKSLPSASAAIPSAFPVSPPLPSKSTASPSHTLPELASA